eukprot:11178369-Lingulodinium_polyedra.AAC.1
MRTTWGAVTSWQKLYTSSMPGASILRVLGAESALAAVAPRIHLVPREKNQWADDLSKGKYEELAAASRVA